MKDEIPDAWVIEVYSGTHQAWSISGLMLDARSHPLEWCMAQIRFAKEAEERPVYKYRLRNVITDDILMAGVL